MTTSKHALPCDHCASDTGRTGRTMLCAEIKSHEPDEDGNAVPARLNVQRWWCFCGPKCRLAWYETATTDELVPKHMQHESDRHLQLVAFHVDPVAGVHTDVTVHDLVRVDSHQELDAYWQSPGPAETIHPDDARLEQRGSG